MKPYQFRIEMIKGNSFEEEIVSRLQLPDDVAEWLLKTGFWREINEKCHTIFGQFEEDELEIENIPIAISLCNDWIEKIDDIIALRRADKVDDRVIINIDKNIIVRELKLFIDFINFSYKNNYRIIIYL